MSGKQQLLIAAACAVLGVTEARVRADVVTPNADAYISREFQSGNFGTASSLLLKNAAADASADYDRKAYLRFDLSPIAPQPVAQSILTLHVILGQGGEGSVAGQNINFSLYGLNDGDPGETWGETTITWNNAPQNDTASGDGVLGNTTLLGGFSLVGTGVGSTVNFSSPDLTSFLNQDSDDLVTLILVRNFFDSFAGGYVHAFGSRESGSSGASLEVTAVPEPSSIFMILCVSFLTLSVRGVRSK